MSCHFLLWKTVPQMFDDVCSSSFGVPCAAEDCHQFLRSPRPIRFSNSTIVKQKYRLSWTNMRWYIGSVIQRKTAEVIFTNLTFSGCLFFFEFWRSPDVKLYALIFVRKRDGKSHPMIHFFFLFGKNLVWKIRKKCAVNQHLVYLL